MKRAIILLMILFVSACGGSGGGGSGDSISITDAYFTPNPAKLGETAELYFYLESTSDCSKIKWFKWENYRDESGESPVSISYCSPPEWRNLGEAEVTGEPGERWLTFWFAMNDGAESQKLTVEYTAIE